jgi:hypothetical protein
MIPTSSSRLIRLVLPALLAAVVSSACAEQSTREGREGREGVDGRGVPFQITFEPDGQVIVKSHQGKILERKPVTFPFKFGDRPAAGVQMYNFNAFRFAGSSYMIFCMGPGYCFCIDLPDANGVIGNACSTLH